MKSGMIVHPSELTGKWIDKIALAGITTLGIHPEGGGGAPESLRRLLSFLETEEYRSLIDYALSRGIKVEYEIHAAGFLMERTMFDTHPEYFRMNSEGKRTPDWNFCVSNEEALAHFAERAEYLARALYGSGSDFYFWMDDGRDTACHCPKCRGLSASDQQLIALKAALSGIRKYIPNARMAYLAYMDSIMPPSVSKPDGIFLEYAPFEKYTARGEDAAARIEKEKSMIPPLLSYFGKDGSKVLEYWYDNSLFSRWKKPPARFTLNETAMLSDVAYYSSLGFERASTFACFLSEDYEALYPEVDITPFANALEKIR